MNKEPSYRMVTESTNGKITSGRGQTRPPILLAKPFGGIFNKHEYGKLYLTETHSLFRRTDKDVSKKWEIVIPLSSFIITEWNVEEQARRKQISALGSSINNIGFGSGMIHETGKAHQIVVPYIDEHGIPQEPRFGISSFKGKAIREWALELYRAVANTRTGEEISNSSINQGVTTKKQEAEKVHPKEDPLHILKKCAKQLNHSNSITKVNELGILYAQNQCVADPELQL